MTLHYYSDLATQTTLTNSVSNSATQITVASTTGFPASFPYYLALDFSINGNTNLEVVEVTAAASLLLTVTRGVSGTSAVAHSNGAAVVHVAPAQFYNDTSVHTNSNSGVHGVTGSVVGTTDTQTLTNKTVDGGSNTLTNLNASNITSGTLAIAEGGTNASTASGARTNLGLAIGTNVEAWSAGLDATSTMLAGGTTGIVVQTGVNTVAHTLVTTASGNSGPSLTWTNGNGVSGNVTANLVFKSPAPTVTTGTPANGATPGTGTTFSYSAPSPMPAYLLIYGCNSGSGGGGTAGAASSASAGGGAAGAASAWKTVATSGLTFPLQVVAPGGSAGGTGNASGGLGVQATVKDNNGAGSTLWTPGAPASGGVGRGDSAHSSGFPMLENNNGYDPTTSGSVADYVVYGEPGQSGILLSVTQGSGGSGGNCHFGGGASSSNTIPNSGQNVAASGYGGGGGGAGSTTAAGQGGGGGGSIVVIVPIY